MTPNNSLVAAAIATVHHGHSQSLKDSNESKDKLRAKHMLVQQQQAAAKVKATQATAKGTMA